MANSVVQVSDKTIQDEKRRSKNTNQGAHPKHGPSTVTTSGRQAGHEIISPSRLLPKSHPSIHQAKHDQSWLQICIYRKCWFLSSRSTEKYLHRLDKVRVRQGKVGTDSRTAKSGDTVMFAYLIDLVLLERRSKIK